MRTLNIPVHCHDLNKTKSLKYFFSDFPKTFLGTKDGFESATLKRAIGVRVIEVLLYLTLTPFSRTDQNRYCAHSVHVDPDETGSKS